MDSVIVIHCLMLQNVCTCLMWKKIWFKKYIITFLKWWSVTKLWYSFKKFLHSVGRTILSFLTLTFWNNTIGVCLLRMVCQKILWFEKYIITFLKCWWSVTKWYSFKKLIHSVNRTVLSFLIVNYFTSEIMILVTKRQSVTIVIILFICFRNFSYS